MKFSQNLSFALLAFIFCSFVSVEKVSATHIVGSEITYACTQTPGIFKVTLILYRKCDGGSAPLCQDSCGGACTQQLQLQGVDGSYASTTFGTINLSLENVRDINTNSNCPNTKNTCTNMGCVTAGTYTPAIERYQFGGFANIGPTSGIPANCCNVRFSWTLCCRNSNIATGAADANFYLDAIVNRCHSVTPCNNSPVLTNDPVMIVCGGENVILNMGATDPDPDSLSYAFAPALAGFGSPVPYNPPFTYDRPMPWTGNAAGVFPTGIHCDAKNGDIKFTPPMSSGGFFTGVVAVEVKQWKKINGMMTVIGKTRRDFEMTVRPDCLPNNPPRLITQPPSDGDVNIPFTDWEICAGEPFCFTVTARDTDWNPPTISDTTYLSWNGALAHLGATFTADYDSTKRNLPDSIGGGPREDNYQFCWTPTTNMVSTNPYYFTVTGKDDRCPNVGTITRSFSIKVSGKPSVSIQKNIDNCGVMHVSFINNTPTIPIASYMWDIGPANDHHKHVYYQNQDSVSHPVRDTGMYVIRLILTPTTSGSLTCSNVASDSIRTVRTSLIDSIVSGHPTCVYSQDGYINAFAINGVQPYQYALNQGAYSSNHSFTSLPVDTYMVQIKDASGCVIEREVKLEGTRLIQHIQGYNNVNPGDSLLYIGRYKAGAKASWVVSNGTIVGSEPDSFYIFIKWGNNGMGSVKLIVSDSNCSDTAVMEVTIGNVGLAEAKNSMGIKVFPNPTRSILNIQATAVTADARIEVYNILGKLVLEKEMLVNQQLNLETLPNGLYFIKVGDWNTSVVKE